MAASNLANGEHAIAVDVRPARARVSPFRALKIYGAILATGIFALGLWKLWELIVVAQTWYGANRTMVNAALVVALLILFVLTVVGFMSRVRAKQVITKRVATNAKVIARERTHDAIDHSSESLENVELGGKNHPNLD